MATRVAAVIAIVPHHKHMIMWHDDLELDGGRLGAPAVQRAGQIGRLVQRLAVDTQASGSVTADHPISGHPNHPLDQVLGGSIGEHANKLESLTDWAALAWVRTGQPAAGIFEDDHCTAL